MIWNIETLGVELNLSRYSMLALGSSAYPNYCKAGKDNRELARLGAKALSEKLLADELDGQAHMAED